jgi:hypothetical protein
MPIRGADDLLSGWQAIVASGKDGVYEIVVAPGKGHLLIFGPSPDFVLETISERTVYGGKPGGRRWYTHKVIAYDVKPGQEAVEKNAALRPGKTIAVRVAGPSGETINHGFYVTALDIAASSPEWRGDAPNPIRDGRFELHGLAPETAAHVDILDDEHQWGASVDLSGKQAAQVLTVTLQPCGQAKARFVGPDGRPVADFRPDLEYVATPGPHPFTGDKKAQAELSADAEYLANVDRKHYWDGPSTDAEGRITLPSLIPGALYRINDFSTVNDPDKGAQVRRDFRVKPGQTLDLGDILIEKPRG